jgi:hypothetical protein
MSKVLNGFLVCIGLGLILTGDLAGQNPGNPPAYTVITVEKMHCESCAKRIAGKLYEVAGVEKIQLDVQKKILWIQPMGS